MYKLPPYNSYWVIPQNFMAGEYPGHRYNEDLTQLRLDALIEAGIRTYIDLTTPNERVPYEATVQERAGYYGVKVQYHRFSIGDFGTPSRQNMRIILDTIHNALAQGNAPYVHCWAGMGRTGTVVGCYLVETGMNGADALKKVNKLCYYAPSPQTVEQKNFVRDWSPPQSPHFEKRK